MQITFGARLYSLAALLCAASAPALAQNYVGASTLGELRTLQTYTYVGLEVQPANTCSSFGAHFRFDHTTADGKALLSSLLLARTSGRQIAAWYTTSTAIGAIDNACTANLSQLSGVRVY
jgi:hypothetical protein